MMSAKPFEAPVVWGVMAISTSLVMALIDAVMVVLQRPTTHVQPYLAGLTLIGVIWLLTLVLSRGYQRTPHWLSLSASIAVYGAESLMLLEPTSQIAFNTVLVAWWLGHTHLMRGVLVTFLATVGMSIPVIVSGSRPWEHLVMLVLVNLCIAMPAATASALYLARGFSLTQARRQRDSVFEAAEVGIGLIDADGDYVHQNPSMAHLRALSEPAESGGVAHIYADAKGTAVEPDLYPTNRGRRGEAFQGELYWLGSRDEGQRVVAISIRPIRLADGTFDGAVVVAQDVSDLMRALHLKDEFVAAVSHELRTPLTSILGYVEFMLEDEATEPETSAHLQRVLANAQRLKKLVEDLLWVARDAPTLRVERLELPDVILRAQEVCQPLADASRVKVYVAQRAAMVDGDSALLQQLVEHLISNGVKYNHPGGNVWVSCETSGPHAVITVVDDGRGIPDDELPNVFERFLRGSQIRKDAIAGVGVGLAICRDIVRGHGGNITITSELGEGTSVTVRLPLSQA